MGERSVKKSGRDKSIYVVCGKDQYLVSLECERLVDELVPAEQRGMSLYQPESDKAELKDVLDELRTLPFLSARRVVLMKDSDGFISNNRAGLEKYFREPAATGVLILAVNQWRSNTKLAKMLGGVGSLVQVAQMYSNQLPAYVMGICGRKFGKTISKQTAEFVVELVGDEPGRLASEIEKLSVYVGDRKVISTEDVEELIGHNRTFNAFSVIDCVMAGNCGEAVGRLRNMFAADKDTEYTVVGAFAYHFRRMFQARSMADEGMMPEQIAAKMGLNYTAKKTVLSHIGKMRLLQIGKVLRELAVIDYSIKSGRMRCSIAMEELVARLCGVFA